MTGKRTTRHALIITLTLLPLPAWTTSSFASDPLGHYRDGRRFTGVTELGRRSGPQRHRDPRAHLRGAAAEGPGRPFVLDLQKVVLRRDR